MLSKQSFRPLGLLAGVGVASGALGIYYLWRQQRGSILLEALEEVEGVGAAAQPERQKQAPTLAGAQEPPSGVSEEQAEIRWHLDSIQTCLDGLKEEVTSLKQCIQGFVGRQVSAKRYKSARRRKRRYEAKRESDDSTESLSVYFTANAEKSSDSETEAGQTEIPAGSDCSMLTFATAKDRVALDADPSSPLQLQEEIGHAVATNEAEMAKVEEEVNNLVQVLNFSPPLEHEANSVQRLQPPEDDKNEITSLLHEIDRLHDGTKEEQEQGFKVLLDYKNKYGKRKEFCWRMIRAYSDMFQLTEDKETQNCYALAGRDEGMASVKEHEDSIECQIWLAIVSGYVEHQEADDSSEGNEEPKEIEDEVGVLDEPSNSLDLRSVPATESVVHLEQHDGSDIMNSTPNIGHLDDTPKVTEITDEQHPVLQDKRSQRESNILFEVLNSFDTVYSQPGTSSATDLTELTVMEDRNKDQDRKALDEANMMVKFIDGYHIMFRNECLLDAPDSVKTVDSDNDQDEADEVKDV